MSSLCRVLFSNIRKSIGRSIIINVTLLIATISLFTTLGFKDVLVQNQISDTRLKEVGKSNYIITKSKNSDMMKFGKAHSKLTQFAGILGVGGSVDKGKDCIKFEIVGCTLNEFNKMFYYDMIEGQNNINLNEAIISESASKELNLKLRDSFKVYIMGKALLLKVKGISGDGKIFSGNNERILVTRETLQKSFNIGKNDINRLYVKSNLSIEKIRKEAKKMFGTTVDIKNSIEYNSINADVNSYLSVLGIILFFVILLSVLIIYSSYKTIIYKRFNFIGTLKAIGVSDRKVFIIHLIECVIYGIISSILGVALSLVIRSSITNSISNVLSSTDSKNNFSSIKILMFITVVIISLFISVICTVVQMQVSKMSIKELISDGKPWKDRKVALSVVAAIYFIIVSIVSFYTRRSNNIGIYVILLISQIITFVSFIDAVLFLLHRLTKGIKVKSVIYAALRNVLQNKSLFKNIGLLAVGGMIIMLIGVFSYSTASSMSSFYNEYKCDLTLSSDNINRDKIKVLENSPFVKEFYVYTSINIGFNHKGAITTRVIDTLRNFSKYYSMNLKYKNKTSFENGRNVIITEIYSDKYNLKIGDQVTLKQNNKECKYNVYNISKSMVNMGDTIYLPKKYAQLDFNANQYNAAFINSNNVIKCKRDLDKKLSSTDDNVVILKDKIKKDEKNSKMIFSLFYIFALFASLIGIIGVMNNLVLSTIVRRKEFAIYKSIGVTFKKHMNLLLLESVLIGIIGGVMAVLGSISISSVVSKIIFGLGLPIQPKIIGQEFYVIFAFIIVLSFLPTLISLKGIIRRNLLEDIRYE